MESSTNGPISSKPAMILNDEWREKLRAEERQRRRLSHEKALGGPVAYEKFTFEKFDPELNGTQKILKACMDFDPTKDNLFIVGPQGVGKTHLATAIARRALDNGGLVRLFSKKELAAFIRGKKSYVNEADEMESVVELSGLNVWVIDDIEEDPNRDTILSGIKLAIERRHKEGRFGCVVTSNKALDELTDIIGPKLSDRIEGYFKHLVVPPETPSARAIIQRRKKSS